MLNETKNCSLGNKWLHRAGVALILLSLFGPITHVGANTRKFKDVNGKARVKESLSLTQGIFYDKSIGEASSGISIKGTAKETGLVKLQYDSNNRMLRLIPKNIGVGTLLVIDNNTGNVVYEFIVDVKKSNLQKMKREIEALLKDIEGIKTIIVNDKVIVDGEILLPQDMKRIHSVVKQYGNLAASFVRLSPLAQNKIAQFIEKEIDNPEIHVKSVNGKFILEGWARNEEERSFADIIAKTYVPDVVVDEAVADKKVLERKVDVVINLIKIKPAAQQEPAKIVQLVVHYVEMQKDYSRSFRFQWMPDLGDGSALNFSSGGREPGGVVSTITGTIRNLIPKLNWMKEHGHARVLKSSSIIVQDREQGVINSISRIPYQTVGGDGNPATDFEEAGIRTTITPIILGARSDSVNLKLNFAVKSLVSITDRGPLTTSREIQTVLVVQSGSSAAVGGLIEGDTSTDYNKLPQDVSQNPIISLYASKSFRRHQSQFVVFVTPIIKSSASAGSERIKKKFRIND